MYNYPSSPQKMCTKVVGCHQYDDYYAWLEDAKSQETLSWTEAQNTFTDGYFSDTQDYDFTKNEAALKGKTKKASYHSIFQLKDKLFVAKSDKNDKNSLVICDTQLNELQTIADDTSFHGEYILFGATPSLLDNGICLISALKHGAPRPSILVYDYIRKELLHVIHGVFSFFFGADGNTVYYADAVNNADKTFTKNFLKAYDIKNHCTETIYEHTEHAPFMILGASQDGNYIFIHARKDYTSCNLLVYSIPDKTIRSVSDNTYGPMSYLGSNQTSHFILSQIDNSFGDILSMDLNGGTIHNAKVLVKGDAHTIVSGAIVTSGKLIVSFMKDASSCLSVYEFDGKFVKDIELPDTFCSCASRGFGDPKPLDGENYYINYQSFVTSPTIYKLDCSNDTLKEIYKEVDAPKQLDIVVEQKFITARDGTKVPAFIVRQKDMVQNGANPTIMYGYGGYGSPLLPSFSNPFIGQNICDLVKQGYVYVNCNLRGGSEYGVTWHEGGKLANKKNVFYDFIDITEWLIANKYTTPAKIAICGGSNGGLLMTTLITMRPDLWGAVIASVPHTDMINFASDDRGPMYITEYGDPKNNEMYDYLLSYSPYQNIQPIKYPAIYLQTGECDNNVPPYHAKKFAARMQELNQSNNPVLLRVLKEGSHDRGRGDVMYKVLAEMQTFIEKNIKF